MTYQRNILRSLKDGVDEGLPDGVHQAEPAAGDEDEPEDDGRGLEDVLAVRPLHAAQLVDAGAQEGDDPARILLDGEDLFPQLLTRGAGDQVARVLDLVVGAVEVLAPVD